MIQPSYTVKYSVVHCRRSAPMLFPFEKTTGRILSAPTQTVPPIYLGGDFGAFVGAAISRPPTLQISGQNRYTPTKPSMLQIYHVSTYYHRISFANVRWCHCRRSAQTLFPRWGNNRADTIRPQTVEKPQFCLMQNWGFSTVCKAPAVGGSLEGIRILTGYRPSRRSRPSFLPRCQNWQRTSDWPWHRTGLRGCGPT